MYCIYVCMYGDLQDVLLQVVDAQLPCAVVNR